MLIMCSIRSFTSCISRIACFSSIFKTMWAAIVSASLAGSSIPEIEVITSGAIFLLSFTYWSKESITDRLKISTSLSSTTGSSMIFTCASKYVSPYISPWISALSEPSTSTFIVPSGNFNSWSTVASVPYL